MEEKSGLLMILTLLVRSSYVLEDEDDLVKIALQLEGEADAHIDAIDEDKESSDETIMKQGEWDGNIETERDSWMELEHAAHDFVQAAMKKKGIKLTLQKLLEDKEKQNEMASTITSLDLFNPDLPDSNAKIKRDGNIIIHHGSAAFRHCFFGPCFETVCSLMYFPSFYFKVIFQTTNRVSITCLHHHSFVSLFYSLFQNFRSLTLSTCPYVFSTILFDPFDFSLSLSSREDSAFGGHRHT